jgi:hypothetical protein
MTQEQATPPIAAVRPSTLAPDLAELTDAELAFVVGGGDGGPSTANENNGRSGV